MLEDVKMNLTMEGHIGASNTNKVFQKNGQEVKMRMATPKAKESRELGNELRWVD